jgi:hypothetical protein
MVRREILLRVLVVASAAWVLAGCSNDDNLTGPPRTPTPTPPFYEVRSSPQNVLKNLVKAYQSRDSVEYKELYDSTYVGKSTNPNAPAYEVLSFRYYDEGSHVAHMARDTSITSVVLDLGPATSWIRQDASDPSHPEWALIQLTNYKVQINTSTVPYIAGGNPGDLMTFTFQPSTPATSSPTDTLWRVIRWEEISSPY